MQLRSTFLTLLIVAFASTSIATTVPRSDEEHKFNKRSPRSHSGGGGGMGMGKMIAGGTILAGTGAFAGTAGSMAAHHVFGSDDHEKSNEDGGGARMVQQQQPVYAPVSGQPQYAASSGAGAGGNVGGNGGGGSAGGPAYPVGVLMSNGEVEAIPKGLLQQAQGQYADQGQQQQQGGGGGFVFPNN